MKSCILWVWKLAENKIWKHIEFRLEIDYFHTQWKIQDFWLILKKFSFQILWRKFKGLFIKSDEFWSINKVFIECSNFSWKIRVNLWKETSLKMTIFKEFHNFRDKLFFVSRFKILVKIIFFEKKLISCSIFLYFKVHFAVKWHINLKFSTTENW